MSVAAIQHNSLPLQENGADGIRSSKSRTFSAQCLNKKSTVNCPNGPQLRNLWCSFLEKTIDGWKELRSAAGAGGTPALSYDADCSVTPHRCPVWSRVYLVVNFSTLSPSKNFMALQWILPQFSGRPWGPISSWMYCSHKSIGRCLMKFFFFF